MNTPSWIHLLLGAASAAALTGAAAAQTIEMPPRKAGLWEITMTSEGEKPHKARHCVDEKTDRQMQQMSRGAMGGCTAGTMKKDGSSLVFEHECTMGKTKVASRSVMTGDFNTKVRTEVTSTFTPPMMGKSKDKMMMDAQWTGACPSGWKAGDMEMPGGMRMNVNQMMQMMPGAAGGAKK